MDIEEYREYCIQKPGVTEECPFGPDTLVFKVLGKMFALTNIETFESINLKCNPELAVKLREEYDEVLPGYHMNKKHWNTILMSGAIPDNKIRFLIDHSYDLVVEGLPKRLKQDFNFDS